MLKKVLFAAFIVVAAYVIYEWVTFPDVSELKDQNPTTTSFMDRRKKELRRAGKDDTIHYDWVPYSRISPYLRRAVLVSEDNSFFEHEGVDVEGLKEALRRDWEQKRFSHGGSTVTQQLAKNLYLSPARNPLRKLKEYVIARALERQLTKKRILELYLNVVEFGERVYGAEAAARYYFDKSAAALSPREAALLAGALPNPRVMVPSDPNRRLRARQRIILARMRRWGAVAEKQVLAEKKPAAGPESSVPGPESPVPGPESQVPGPESGVPSPEIDTSVPDEPETGTAPEEPAPPTETAAPPPAEPVTTTTG